MSKWGTKLIKGLIEENEAKEAIKKREKDDSWKKDPIKYEKSLKKAEKVFKEPIIISQLKNK